jgi:uncharacterized phage protein gp47/JayE
MATAPQIKNRDGSGYSQSIVYTTNQTEAILEGTVAVDTADIQVSVNGSAFASDPNLVKIVGQTFTIPNLDVYPTGLLLEPGDNLILLRVIDIVGGVSSPASASIKRVVQTTDQAAAIPSGIQVHRKRDSVDIVVAKPELPTDLVGQSATTTQFVGFNFYASVLPAGESGYFRINEKPVTTASTVYEEKLIYTPDPFLAKWDDCHLLNLRVRVTEEDFFGNELATRLDHYISAEGFFHKVRFDATIQDYTLTEYVVFNHLRGSTTGTINSDQWVGVPVADPLYYVVTAVYYDPATSQETETPYSQEVLGAPLILDTTLRDLPGRVQLQVVLDYVSAIQRVNQEIALIPGSTTRDVSIDPFASEAERIWFLLDFVHRSQSFLTLLQIDDTNGDGISDDPATSNYKQALKAALGLTTNSAVQSLIDQQFDKLAANVQKPRLGGRPSVGQVVGYTATRPSKDIIIPANSYVSSEADSANNVPALRFRIGGSYTMLASQADAYYNFNTKRYEIILDIVCETVGSVGNRPAGAIKTITGVSGLSVINTEATVFGTNTESNSDLASRCMLGFVSVDTGTEGGYKATSAAQTGIIKAKVVKSGDPLMMRDWDEVRKKHIGGKVDVWVQGLRERQISEQFAFTFDIARDIQCLILDLPTLTFRVQDSRVTPDTPIVEILDNPSQGLGVRNGTTGMDYDLTGVQILDYQTFRLSTAVVQPTTHIDDAIYADYRFRSVNQFFFTYQPVRRVVSVVGEVAGPLNPSTNFLLYKTDDPLLDGESTIAKNYLSIIQFGGVPTGNTITINNEVHVLIGFVQEPLDSIGINTKTLRVYNELRTIEFNGPEASDPDFEIIEGTPTTPVKIVRTSTSTIASGQIVSVDYVHDENFTVAYVINDLLQELQQVVNTQKHTTADVLAKQAVENPIDIETTVQLKKGAAKDKVDPALRSAVSLELNRKTIGQGTAQSDLINAIDSTDGVDYEVVPMARLAYADGSVRLREAVLSTAVRVPTLDIGSNRAWLLVNSLQNPTTDGGGMSTEHHGVFQDDEAMGAAKSLTTTCSVSYQAFIIGFGGASLSIPGYTDPATLTADGYITPAEQAAETIVRTANRAMLSIPDLPGDDPSQHEYAVSYVIRGASGANDIMGSDVEFIELGDFTVTYREAT